MESKKTETSGCHVNVKLIPLKITYFILLGAHASILPYLPVYMGVLNLTPIQMSIILGVATVFAAPIRLMVGYVGDRFQIREMAFAVTSVFTVIFHLSLYFIPTEDSTTYTINDYSMRGSLCYKTSYFTLEAFNETMEVQNNYTSSFNRSEIKCCAADSENSSTCHDIFFNKIGDNLSIVNNISDVEQWFTSRNFQTKDHPPCIDIQYCNKTTFIHMEPSNNQKTFWLFFILYFFAHGTLGPLYNLLDSLIYSILKTTGKPEDFGKSRLWGTIGFGFFAFLSGIIQDALSKQGWIGRESFVITFVNFSVGSLVVIFLILITKAPTEEIYSDSRKTNNTNLKKDLANSFESEIKPFQEDPNLETYNFENIRDIVKIMCGFYLSIIIMTGMISGIAAGCLEVFFYYFLVTLDPNNKSVLGICLAVSCTCEAIVLFFSGKILSFLGLKRCLYLVFVVFVIRFTACSYLENPWYGLIIETTHCICFGLLFPVISSCASSLVPAQLQSTVQCYLGAIYFSAGRATGSGLAGFLYERFGPRVMFRVFAVISGSYLIVLVFVFEILDRIKQKKMRNDQNGVDKVVAKTDGQEMNASVIEENVKTTTHL